MKTLTKKHFSVLSFIMALFVVFTMSSCSLFESDMKKEDAIKIYEDLGKSLGADSLEGEEVDFIKAIASLPIKKIEVKSKSSAKTKDVEEVVETTESEIFSISGDETNFSLEMKVNDGKEEKTSYLYIKDSKYYHAEEGKTDKPEEMTKENFELGVTLTYMVRIYGLGEESELLGISELKEGFESAKKSFNSLTLNAKILDRTVKVTLSKEWFKDEYKLKEFQLVTKETKEDTTTTTETTIKYTYK